MPSRRYVVTPAVLAAAASVVLAAGCTGSATSSPSTSAGERIDDRGGTVTALTLGPVATWDPQRIAAREDMAFASRVFVRTLTAYAPAGEGGEPGALVGDLATGTGTPDASLTTWTFTIRDGVKWQDNTSVTCQDVAYGISRTFATREIVGGPGDALAVLDIPRSLDGASTYKGPYDRSAANRAAQEAFDKAVSCSGSTLTIRLSAPLSDFPEMLTEPAFGAVNRERDRGADGPHDVFSAGPYQLENGWRAGTGGVFIRNPHWTADTDPVRKAYPDRIDYREGLEPQAVAQQILADGDLGRSAVALGSVPPSLHQELVGVSALKDRLLNPLTGVTEYLVPNTAHGPMANELVRQALAVATNRQAYATALGGPTVAAPAVSVIPQALPASHTQDPLKAGARGDSAAAAALLAKAKVKTPVPITVAYRAGEAADKGMAALAAGWTEAGFDVTLQALGDDYFGAIGDPRRKVTTDVFWSNWSPAWASASTVLGPLFNSSVNLTATGPGRDYGYFADPVVDARMARIDRIADPADREEAWQTTDIDLLTRGVYIGLVERKAVYIAGSSIRNFSAAEVLGGVVELADIAVTS